MNRASTFSGLPARMGAAVLLAAAADILFFDSPIGFSVALFGALLVVAIVAVHPARAASRASLLRAGLAAAALLPLVENISGLSLSLALIGLSIFALSVSGHLRSGATGIPVEVAGFLIAAPFRLPGDLLRARRGGARKRRAGIRLAGVAVWVMPVVLGAVFLFFFGIANPVIDHWISLIDPWAVLELLDLWRIAFWLCVAVFAWAFLRPRLPEWLRRRAAPAAVTALPEAQLGSRVTPAQILFGKPAILRALIVFNLLFAVQTVLDAAYLWGGVALPDGLTYAGYAHRGAYPLIVTALLAAAFVLLALRPGSETSADRRIRLLVYAWTAQNVTLVISSILRLDLYVGVYSLTYLRVAAFIWMGLVAAGLVFIMARIALGKSNGWLLAANLLTLSAVLYACCFINFAAMIAHYNVTHSRELNGGGLALDGWYLRSLGPAAIPAMDFALEHSDPANSDFRWMIQTAREDARDDVLARLNDWRAWTFRDWRLARYLDDRPVVPAGPPAPGS